MADHPIFTESIRRIRALLGETGLDPLQQQVLERLVHSSGDVGLEPLLRFSEGACEQGIVALKAGAMILTDTAMAAAAVSPMAMRTLGTSVRCLLDWAPAASPQESTRSAVAMQRAWPELTHAANATGQPMPLLLVGSAPTALEQLLDQLDAGAAAPSLVIGMPVGFVGVPESKRRLADTVLAQIRLEGTRGGAGLVAAATNALLRAAQAAS
ncbi:precorrin-8X methylmutase [Synechococcus sp. UW179A]|uniref:precorrin-8X methylmutase n=1 Tax=Synechococcus sp. UW179A TaxID=2575510 RepID=UPI000E0FEC12|nr:precorrin-8X methylmutase [Synechococcus sp. UW179A]